MRVPDVSDHVRVDADADGESDRSAGIYRVVGTREHGVTLLRVGDEEGRREHTGELTTVDREALAAFQPAENPDRNRPLVATLASHLDGFWWSLRLLGRTVLDRPVPSALALALVAVGLFGDSFLPIPDAGDAALMLVGAFALVYLSRSGSST